MKKNMSHIPLKEITLHNNVNRMEFKKIIPL